MDLKKLPKTEFAAAIMQIAGERKLSDPQIILDAIESGLIAAYKRDQKEKGVEVSEDEVFTVDLDPASGSFHVYQLDGEKRKDVTPPGFGRIAAQTAMQVITNGINVAERDKIMGDYENKVGTLLQGTVLKADSYKLVISLNQTEGICPKDEQIRGEFLKVGDRKLFLIKSVNQDAETGKKDVILSRRDPEFVRQLFMREVPEVGNKTVKIEKIARSAGDRTKVAVSSSQNTIDPVGSCIGQRGARIQAILGELPPHEKVDVILYNKNLYQLVVNALSPAEGAKVTELDKDRKIILVTVPEDQLALAIGSEGSNVRLAGELVGGYDIKVVGASSVPATEA